MRARPIIVVALLSAALAVPGGGATAEVIDRVMAMVGSQVVTLSDVRAAEAFGVALLAAVAGGPATDVVGALINRQLMLGEVERYSAPDPERSVLDRRMAQIRARFATGADYAQALARTAMSDGRLRSLVADDLRIEAYIDQRFGPAAQPTAEEVQRYYREHTAEFTKAGRLAAFEDVQPIVQQKVSSDRRRALIADWLDRLRRRGVVATLPQPGR